MLSAPRPAAACPTHLPLPCSPPQPLLTALPHPRLAPTKLCPARSPALAPPPPARRYPLDPRARALVTLCGGAVGFVTHVTDTASTAYLLAQQRSLEKSGWGWVVFSNPKGIFGWERHVRSAGDRGGTARVEPGAPPVCAAQLAVAGMRAALRARRRYCVGESGTCVDCCLGRCPSPPALRTLPNSSLTPSPYRAASQA